MTNSNLPGDGTSFDPDYYDPVTGQLRPFNPKSPVGGIEDSGLVQSYNGNYITPAAKMAEDAAEQAFASRMGLNKDIPALGLKGTPSQAGLPVNTAAAPVPVPAASEGLFGTGITGTQAAMGLVGLSALGGSSLSQAQQAIENSGLTPEQKAVMNRELTNYTANLNVTTLPSQGTPEYTELMNRIQQGIGVNFMNPTITAPAAPGFAKGGALSMMANMAPSKGAHLARGTGNGRSDTINARLSDGEYVIDAETVALLGNGSTKAGASALDMMRKQLRKQKGKVLAKGKFSPDAKSPLAYMKGGLK
jgi:hypothetical protein